MEYNNTKLIARANELRKNMTKEEKHLWYDFLSKHKLKFKRQHVIDNFIVDFYCHKYKLVIELDGSHHYLDENTRVADQQRTFILETLGLTIIRFPNKEVDFSFQYVCNKIYETIANLSS